MSSVIETQSRSFTEINHWGQIIPTRKYVAVDIYTRCIEAIEEHFQYPSLFSGLIGYLTILTIDHWNDTQKNSLKDPELIKDLQRQAEDIILLGWNKMNTDPTVGVGQLGTLIKTLHTMTCMMADGSTGEDISGASSTICSIIENDWIKQSYRMFQQTLRNTNWNFQLIKCFIDMSKNNFDNYENIKDHLVSINKLRMENMLKTFGSYKLDMVNFQTLVMLMALKAHSYGTLQEQLAWNTGSIYPHYDEYEVGDLPVVSLYSTFASTGAFVKRKQEQLRFKKVHDQLAKFMANEEVSHLFFMSILLNNDETRKLQPSYDYFLQ